MSVHVSDETLEINLTPLLDLVLQLIMFFMACVNFVSEAVSLNVFLPYSKSALEVEASADEERLIINIERVRIEALSGEKRAVEPRITRVVIANLSEIRFTDDEQGRGLFESQRMIHNLANDLKVLLKRRDHLPEALPLKEVRLPIPVVVRADGDIATGLILQILAQCKAEGFSETRLRVLPRSAADS